MPALVERARRTRFGEGMVPGIHLGPLNNKPQHIRVANLVDEAVRAGAIAVSGGKSPDQPGYFYPPTVLTHADDDMRVVAEEQFGPVLPILSYKTVDDAVQRANRSSYGLSGSVLGSDEDQARRVAAQLDCGTSYVNMHLGLEPRIPFGGAKWSGIGVENGAWGLREFMQINVRQTRRRGRK
jgi:acyl-CoA reductase-like NAD-dependent aldehyde dehydrogenase